MDFDVEYVAEKLDERIGPYFYRSSGWVVSSIKNICICLKNVSTIEWDE